MSEHTSRQIFQTLQSAKLVVPLFLLTFGLLLTVLAAAVIAMQSSPTAPWRYLLTLSVPVTFVGLLMSGYFLRSKLLKPLVMLQNSVARVSQGTPGAVVSLENKGALNNLVQDIGSINEELFDLYEDMDSRVERQTRRLAQKTASLKILYDVAATVNQAASLDDLLLRFLRVLKEMVDAKAATVRLNSTNGQMRIVGCVGLDNELLNEQQILPVKLCVCGRTLSPGDIVCEQDPQRCTEINQRPMFGADQVDVITVPLEYHGDVLGIYTLNVEKPGVAGREDILELLKTIGSHLGITVAKHRSDQAAHRLSIISERTALAHELHDSLAQTLASLRFQVRMLSDTLNKNADPETARSDLERIRNGLDEAHTELRALIGNFRAPMDERGLQPALQRIVQRFHDDTGIKPYLQLSCRNLKLSQSEEMQILRIIQESLANIRKHAKAHTVRILLNYIDNKVNMLIEDDGAGFEQTPSGKPGEHIGLSIMQERAQRLGGELRIESDPGEGTRVEMVYSPKSVTTGTKDAHITH